MKTTIYISLSASFLVKQFDQSRHFYNYLSIFKHHFYLIQNSDYEIDKSYLFKILHEIKSDQKIICTYLFIISFLLLAIMIFFYFMFKNKNEQINQQKIKIEEISKRELKTKNSIFSKTEVAKKVESISLSNPNPGKLFQLGDKVMNESDWNELYSKLDDVYENFTLRLKEKYPRISKDDLRLCCLLKLKKGVSDIALLLGINPGSVNKKKSRLKLEKIKLHESLDFDDFLDLF